jgi:hypothetical protein
MRSAVRKVIAALVVASFGLVVAAPAHAAVAERNAKFCKAVDRLGKEAQAPLGSEEITAEQAAEVAKALRKASKKAPRRVKRSMRTMARAYERLADGDTMAEVVKDAGEEFAQGAAVFASYYLKQCVGAKVSKD